MVKQNTDICFFFGLSFILQAEGSVLYRVKRSVSNFTNNSKGCPSYLHVLCNFSLKKIEKFLSKTYLSPFGRSEYFVRILFHDVESKANS